MSDEQAGQDERRRGEKRPPAGAAEHGGPDEHGAAPPGAGREYAPPDGPRPRLLLAGHLTEDVAGDDSRLGGAVAYAGLLARRSGIPTTILTVFDDGFPHLSLLRGIRIERVRSPGRTRFENTYRADGSRTQRLLDRASPIPGAALRAEVRRLPPGSAVLHAPVAGELDGAAPLPLPRRIARDGGDPRPRAGAIVQGFLRRWDASGRISTGWSPEVRKRMAGLDLLSLAEEELPAGDLPAAPVLAVTRGVRGALVLRPGRPEVAVPALPARAVDPTGAGDVFGAALFLLLWRGAPVHRAARIAAAAAAISIESVGVEGVPSLSEATARAHQER